MNMEWAIGLAALVAGIAGGYFIRHWMGRQSAQSSENMAQQTLDAARREAEAIKAQAHLAVKDEVIKARDEFDKSMAGRRQEMSALEERVAQRELNLERKVSMIEKKEHSVDEKLAQVERQSTDLQAQKLELDKVMAEEKDKLQKIAAMTQEEARKTILQRVEKEVHAETGVLIRRIHDEAKQNAEREARKITAAAIQRYAASHASELMTSTVSLAGDEMKGRIIGRDGRNIRALEAATGVNILIDDTPEAVVISGFDPIRREIAKLSLEQLIADGRIHPARIEEVVNKVKEGMEETTRQAGERAAFEGGVQGIPPDLLRLIGRLKFRTSYSQNTLQHSLEVAHLMGVMAGEMQLDTALARRIGLFHDIGKSVDHEVEGGHALIGADLLKKQGEAQVVVNAVAAHHEEVHAESVYAILASAADAISSSRLGARSETTEIYIQRIEKLEAIANGFAGVKKSYAVHAGREVRVLVEPEKIDDNAAVVLARDISKKIESDLQYPGQIRVTVIRETRCVEYAK